MPLPLPAQVGKTFVGGIGLNKARMRRVVEALIALSPEGGDRRQHPRHGGFRTIP
jgi:hypothetical protein